ncbi:MAG: 2-phosphoglycerate kinase [Candidatus Methanolliviera sp. GoM_oil]|nr:MAG: 2-phosphoglycerate kinase [Candidatus Methanolliviera sp. GoM_oil]
MEVVDVRGHKYCIPFSKGILSTSLMRAKLDVAEAYITAAEVEKELETRGIWEIGEEELVDLVKEKLIEEGFEKNAVYYEMWQKIREEKKNVIILIGGATASGKSTIASELGYRFGIRRTIGTDSIREVMRKMLSIELVPSIYYSSFLVGKNLKPPSQYLNKTVYGFEKQTSNVAVGVNALITRARDEGFNLIVEGIHLVPGYIQNEENLFHFILNPPSTEQHKNMIMKRFIDLKRPVDRYMDHLTEIEEIKDYINEVAGGKGVKIIQNYTVSETIEEIMTDVIEKLSEKVTAG